MLFSKRIYSNWFGNWDSNFYFTFVKEEICHKMNSTFVFSSVAATFYSSKIKIYKLKKCFKLKLGIPSQSSIEHSSL